MEKHGNLIKNMSEMLSVVGEERQSDIVTIKTNSERLLQLGRHINATTDLCHSLETRVSYFEGKILVINELLAIIELSYGQTCFMCL